MELQQTETISMINGFGMENTIGPTLSMTEEEMHISSNNVPPEFFTYELGTWDEAGNAMTMGQYRLKKLEQAIVAYCTAPAGGRRLAVLKVFGCEPHDFAGPSIPLAEIVSQPVIVEPLPLDAAAGTGEING